MQILKQIWSDYTQSEEYVKTPECLRGLPEDAEKQLKEILSDEAFIMAEDIIMSAACDAEERGFIQGFKMAMSLREECMH